MATRKVGRPRKPEGEALSERLEIRLTREELNLLRRTADAAGKSLSEWLRGVALGASL